MADITNNSMELMLKYKELLESSFEMAEKNESKIDDYVKGIEGMSGIKNRHFYNNIARHGDIIYLQVGTWKGSSVCSVMKNNKISLICIDNWSEFGGPKEEFLYNFEKCKGDNDAKFIESDCFNVDKTSLGKFNVFMYDGDHSYESHYNSLKYYYDNLKNIFIYIVDDWNWDSVRESTKESIKDLNFKILHSREKKISEDGSVTEDSLGWWNGIAYFILQKNENQFS